VPITVFKTLTFHKVV